jgi:hypothetical protein
MPASAVVLLERFRQGSNQRLPSCWLLSCLLACLLAGRLAGWIGLVLRFSLVIGRLGLRWSVLVPGLPPPLTGLARPWCSRDTQGCDQPFGHE